MRLVDQITLGNSVTDETGKIKWINHPASILNMFCYTNDAGMKPLKITTAILRRMGFTNGVKNLGRFTFKWEKQELKIGQDKAELIIPCEYVHHLQNVIFFLTWEMVTVM